MRRIRVRFVLGGLAIFLIVGLLFLPIFGRTSSRRSPATRNLSNLKGVALGLRLYADDHATKFPDSLEELLPDYIQAPEILAYRDVVSGFAYAWLYYPGFRADSPEKAIVLASPTSQLVAKRYSHHRIVAHVDSSAEIIPEEDFQKALKEQKTPQSK